MELSKIVCPGCTLLCDDIESGTAPPKNKLCEKGQSYFSIEADDQPKHFVHGKHSDLDWAIVTAIRILTKSRSPLICGLDHLTTQAQQAAWKLNDAIGGTIDSSFSNSGRASTFALQRSGKVTATLGEVANRSDLIVFWFCDPVSTHPRLFERLNKPTTAPKRKILVVDSSPTKTSAVADQFFQVEEGSVASLLAALRAKLAGITLEDSKLKKSGMSLEDFGKLHQSIIESQYGSVIYGQPNYATGFSSQFDLATDSLNTYIRKLNDQTRFIGLKLRSDENAQSAENVLAWSSGYPFAVNHNLSFPRFNGLEFSAESTLTRGECDAILFATGADLQSAFAGLSRTAQEHLGTIPKIAFSPIQNIAADVAIQIGVPGISSSGDFCRFDDVSLPVVGSKTESDSTESIINQIAQAVQQTS